MEYLGRNYEEDKWGNLILQSSNDFDRMKHLAILVYKGKGDNHANLCKKLISFAEKHKMYLSQFKKETWL